MRLLPRFSAAVLSSALGTLILSGCGVTSKLPSVNIPFVGGDAVSVNDPLVPFSIGDKISPGHTLKVTVYSGYRSPSRLFRGDVVVDEKGEALFGEYGTVKLAGLDATAAFQAINSVFSRKRGEKIITVQLESIEGLRVFALTGAVKRPTIAQFYDGANAGNALPYAGGLKVEGQSVYIIRDGKRAYFSTLSAAAAYGELAPGDIVHYSGEL